MRHTKKLPSIRLVITAVILAMCCFRCAHQLGPQGGPADILPPRQLVTNPENGSVNVAPGKTIAITFSEWIDRRSVLTAVRIFPQVKGGVAIDIDGATIRVKPRLQFAAATTYHVEVTSQLKDLHNNSIGQSQHLYFSTGAALDSLTLSGCVINPMAKVMLPTLALFKVDSTVLRDTQLIAFPDYVFQCDSLGRFTADHLSRGVYRAIAFSDANNDSRYQIGRETVYLPESSTITLNTVYRPDPAGTRVPLRFFPALDDTARITITTAKALSPRQLLISWSGTVPATACNAAAYSIRRTDSTMVTASIKSLTLLRGQKQLILNLEQDLALAPYQIQVEPFIRFHAKTDSTKTLDSIRFNGTVVLDTIRPRFSGSTPAKRSITGLTPLIRLVFSEPVRCLQPQWFIADSTRDTVSLAIDSTLSDTLVFTPQRSLSFTKQYSFTIPDTLITDLAGNHPVDTSGFLLRFATIDEDSVCLTLAGKADCPLTPDPARRWQFAPLNKSSALTCADKNGSFTFDTLAGGKGTISFFSDKNQNGIYDVGRVFPWQPPETCSRILDTIEARPRWEITGLTVAGACIACDTTTALAPDTAQSKKTVSPQK